MTSQIPTPNVTIPRNLVSSIFLPFCFLSLYLLFEHLYTGISIETLRFYYLDTFTSFCVYIINFISPADNVSVLQNSILSSKANLQVVRTCDGSTAFFLISAAILVFRSNLKLTISGIFFGLVWVLILNTARIVSLYFLMAYNINWFSYFHFSIAPFLIITLCCAYFAFWASYATNTARN